MDFFDYVVVLWSNNDIAFVYGPGNPESGASSTTGMQNAVNVNPPVADLFVPCNTAGALDGVDAIFAEFVPPLVPTMGEWALISLGLILMIFGVVAVGSRQVVPVKA